MRTSGWLMKKTLIGGVSTWVERWCVLHGYQLDCYVSPAAAEVGDARVSIDLTSAALYTAVHDRFGAQYFELHLPTDGIK